MLKLGQYIGVFKLMREAKRRGVEFDQLPDEVVAVHLLPKSRPERYGLVPDTEVTSESPVEDPALAAVKADVAAGNWENAADLVAATHGDWDRRQRVTWTLGSLAAKDDTWLRAWSTGRPSDPHWLAVYAPSLVSLAWDIRGSARANKTSRSQFDGFHRVLAEAQDAAQAATAALPDDPTPWNTWLTLARGLSYGHDEFRTLWSELMARDPLHHNAHQQALQYWCRKWKGSNELAMEFALDAAARSPKFAALPLVAAFEASDTDSSSWTAPAVVASLDSLLARLADQGSDTYLVREDRAYAIYALLELRRFDEAVGQFRALGALADAGPWSYSDMPLISFLTLRREAMKGASRAARVS